MATSPSAEFSAVIERLVTKDARTARLEYPFASAEKNVILFCETLRVKHGFRLGPGEIADALRAFECVGVEHPARVRDALRLVCCSKLEDVAVFDEVFDEFFFPAPQGVPQEGQPPLEEQAARGQPGHERDPNASQRGQDPQRPPADSEETEDDLESTSTRRTLDSDEDSRDLFHRAMQARYSALEGASEAPVIEQARLPAMLAAAERFTSRLRLGRSRKWRLTPRGSRFDFRRTLRSSLATGGDAIHPRWLGHPKRNPRIVVLLDGSRSMLEHTASVLQFAYALSARSRRVDVFTFSTELRDVTRDLRGLSEQRKRASTRLELQHLERSWGGGTRIGASLKTFLRDHAARVLTPDTLVVISSDGLDVGEVEVLEQSLREIKRRSAGIVWLNPLIESASYVPSARGMRAALPHLSAFTHASTPEEFSRLTERLRLR